MTWQQDGPLDYDAGDVGGDMQAGRAASIRFRSDETRKATTGMAGDPRSGPSLCSGESLHSLVTVYLYPIQHEENDGCPGQCVPGSIDLQQQIEYMVCADPEDPGSTERWADYKYETLAKAEDYELLAKLDGAEPDLSTLGAAESEARRMLTLWRPEVIPWHWGGKAPWEYHE